MLSTELATFVEKGVSIIVGTCDDTLMPAAMRALGLRVEGSDELTVFLPVATCGRSLENLRQNSRIAITCARIEDHRTYQLKGRAITIEPALDSDRALVNRYRRAIAHELALVGLPQHISLRINHWPAWAVRVRLHGLYDQTPGPDAGACVKTLPLAMSRSPRAQELEAFGEETRALQQQRKMTLDQIDPCCFQGILPSLIATADLDGEPNITYLSQVRYLDAKHVALSCQFFNKTKRNLLENPFGAINLYHPLTFEAWNLTSRFERAEISGPLFEEMAARIEAIASHTGMTGIFKLLSADRHRCLGVEPIVGFLLPPDQQSAEMPPEPKGGYLTELRGLQEVSKEINAACDLEGLLHKALATLERLFGFRHSMVTLYEEPADGAPGYLQVVASRGYDEEDCCRRACGGRAVGCETVIALMSGVLGQAADLRRPLRVRGMGATLGYARGVRNRLLETGQIEGLEAEVALPGLDDAQAQLALPLLVGERLVGVIGFESRDPLCFDDWDEAFLQVVANVIALAIVRLEEEDGEVADAPSTFKVPETAPDLPLRRLTFFKNDDCIFLDGEYLIRNVPGRILWKILRSHKEKGQREFSNRELRLDASLGMPAYRDNLESRLILLRKRLREKSADIRLAPIKRGRFALELDCRVELEER